MLTQMLVPTGARPFGPAPTATTRVTVLVPTSILDTVPSTLFTTHTWVPSNATWCGRPPTATVAAIAPFAGSTLCTCDAQSHLRPQMRS